MAAFVRKGIISYAVQSGRAVQEAHEEPVTKTAPVGAEVQECLMAMQVRGRGCDCRAPGANKNQIKSTILIFNNVL